MQDQPFFINEEVRRRLGPSQHRPGFYQAYSGTDIRAILYLPLLTRGSIDQSQKKQFKIFADLQTISISSTRSVSPVRVFGSASPIAYTRGARTFAGTLVFAALNTDPFKEVFDYAVSENSYPYNTSLVSDQLPPFSIIITASNESGGAAIQAIHGITLTNYGTTYSIDDLYTEMVYSYVATDVIPLSVDSISASRKDNPFTLRTTPSRNVSDAVLESLKQAYGTEEQWIDVARWRWRIQVRDTKEFNDNSQGLQG